MKEAQWALVTGASSGLGKEFARHLAARKIHVILAARREAPMQELAEELRRKYDVEVMVEPLNLAVADAALTLQRKLEERGIVPDILINNAAFGLVGEFLSQPVDRLREMLQVDITSLVELTHVFGNRMVARGSGRILLVASLAAYQPTPLFAVYGAAKHFVLAFGEALHVELAPTVGVTVVSPGVMETEFGGVSGYRPKESLRRTMVVPARVAELGLKAMFAGKSSVIVGRLNRLAAFSTRFMSRRLQARLSYRMAQE